MNQNQETYKVTLDMFSGPLDLLLYLIKEAEVEITEVPVSTIVDQYIELIGRAQSLDINVAADFLVMAATLLEIKSRSLLPVEEVNFDEIEDPGFELVKQVMEYRRFKELAGRLAEKADERALMFERLARFMPEGEDVPEDEKPLEEVSLWDLVSAFEKLMKETLGGREYRIEYSEVSVKEMMEFIVARLRSVAVAAFASLFAGVRDRIRMVALFLALLELVRLKRVRAEQQARFGEIQIALAE
jgi:segregation and condensation protein A